MCSMMLLSSHERCSEAKFYHYKKNLAYAAGFFLLLQELAGDPGFEPGLTDPESAVLPLD